MIMSMSSDIVREMLYIFKFNVAKCIVSNKCGDVRMPISTGCALYMRRTSECDTSSKNMKKISINVFLFLVP